MQWFHRNPLKASSRLDFDLGLIIKSVDARKLASDASSRRVRLLELISNPDNDSTTVLEAFQLYINSTYGYVYECDGNKTDSKIRFTKHIRWSNSIDLKGATPETHVDFVFEWASMFMNVALWYSKKAAKLSAAENINENEAKEVHRCLRHAAGLMKHSREELFPKMVVQLPPESDGDANILDAYINQFSAEAQEVVMAQAIEKGHEPSLIAKLAFNTSESYERARLCLQKYQIEKVGKWRMYCLFKRLCYLSYAHTYHVLVLLKDDKAGEAVTCGQKAQDFYNKAMAAAKEYSNSPGVGLTVKPADHLFFRNLGPLIDRNLQKATHENTLIYHQKIPPNMSELNLKAEYGLAAPQMPDLALTWADEWKTALDGFDPGRMLPNLLEEQKRAKETKTKHSSEAPLEDTKEQPVYATDKDPNTKSGCVIS